MGHEILKVLISAEGFLQHVTDNEQFYVSKTTTAPVTTESSATEEKTPSVTTEPSVTQDSLCYKTFKTLTSILSKHNHKQVKALLDHERFVSHLLSLPPSKDGKTPLSEEAFQAVILNRAKILETFFTHPHVVEHLCSISTEKYPSTIFDNLLTAIVLNRNKVLPLFFKIPYVFDHLLSCLSKGNLEDAVVLKCFLNAGLMMSLSSRSEQEITDLTHDGVVAFLKRDTDLLALIVSDAIDDRNPHLARRLLLAPDVFILSRQIQDALMIPAIWKSFSVEEQSSLLDRVQVHNRDFTLDKLQEHHTLLTAYEHTLMGHPLLVQDMETHAFDQVQSYRKLLEEEQRPDLPQETLIEIQSQKKNIQRAFLNALQPLQKGMTQTPPWSHSQANFAYDKRYFGQAVKAMVVELEMLPIHQKDRLLKDKLDEKTSYKKKVSGSRSNHNVGVTSLVSQMAPLAKIVSTTTSKLAEFEEELKAGKYPFINCSWGPTEDLSEDKSISIFASHKTLDSLLGRQDVVIVKSAGNESTSLSNPNLKGDLVGIVFSKLLNRLTAEQQSNLILAVNLTPRNLVAESSNTPGYKETLYRHFICAQGSDTFWLDETGNNHLPMKDGGTSSSAPVITGAALLLQSYKPRFSAVLIKACLLHSALREFMMHDEEYKPVSWVYESKPNSQFQEDNFSQRQFAFSTYGMGILNIQSAFQYADVLEAYLNTREKQMPETLPTFEEFENLRQKLPPLLDEKNITPPVRVHIGEKSKLGDDF